MADVIYWPILKAKAAELWALEMLKPSSRSRILPLLEITPPPKPKKKKKDDGTPKKQTPVKPKSVDDYLAARLKAITGAIGKDEHCFLDTKWLHGPDGSPDILAKVFDLAEKNGLLAIPVACPSYSKKLFSQISSLAKERKRGALLRVSRHELIDLKRIEMAAELLGVPKSQIYFLLDYQNGAMSDLGEAIERIPAVQDWKSLGAASGTFPKSTGSLRPKRWHSLDRDDWRTWEAAAKREVARVPIFGDYTVRDPGKAAEGGNAPVIIRYTTDKSWLVRHDGRTKTGEAENIRGLCLGLIERRKEWCGDQFSEGDKIISDTAEFHTEGTGGAQQWLAWAISHHLEFVIHQLVKMRGA